MGLATAKRLYQLARPAIQPLRGCQTYSTPTIFRGCAARPPAARSDPYGVVKASEVDFDRTRQELSVPGNNGARIFYSSLRCGGFHGPDQSRSKAGLHTDRIAG